MGRKRTSLEKNLNKAASAAGIKLDPIWARRIIEAGYKYVFVGIPIQGYEPSPKFLRGLPGERIPFKGPKFILTGDIPHADIVFGNDLNDLNWFDSKSRKTSSFTSAQRRYQSINQYGGQIVLRDNPKLRGAKATKVLNFADGTGYDLHGIKIKPVRGHIGFAADLLAIDQELLSTTELLDQRRGNLSPDEPDYPQQEVLKESSNRGTANRGTRKENRGHQQANRETSDPGTSKGSKGQQQSGRSNAPKSDSIADDALRIKSGTGKKILKFGGRLLVDQLISMVVRTVIGYFEDKVNEQNMLRLKADWRSDIAPTMQPFIDRQIQKSLQGKFDDSGNNNQKYVYVEAEWTLLLRELREDKSDMVVWAGKFVAGAPGFGEVYYGVRLDRKPETHRPWHAKRAKDWEERRHKHRKLKHVNEYTFHQFILVHDPHVLFMARGLQAFKNDVEKKFRRILLELNSAFVRILPPEKLVNDIHEAVENYKFINASNLMDQLANKMNRDAFVSISTLKELVKSTRSFPFKIGFKRWHRTMTDKQRSLLNAYLGTSIAPEKPSSPGFGRDFGRRGESRGERPSTHQLSSEPGKRFK